MNAISRCMWHWAYSKEFKLSFTHCPGVDMTLPVAISRMCLGGNYAEIVYRMVGELGLGNVIPDKSALDYSMFL